MEAQPVTQTGEETQGGLHVGHDLGAEFEGKGGCSWRRGRIGHSIGEGQKCKALKWRVS